MATAKTKELSFQDILGGQPFSLGSGTATPSAYINGFQYVTNNYPVLTSMTLQEIKV